eukprot:15484829-Alexandrium_andersonii.AAC.1
MLLSCCKRSGRSRINARIDRTLCTMLPRGYLPSTCFWGTRQWPSRAKKQRNTATNASHLRSFSDGDMAELQLW